ncbi:TRAP transporter small permease [Brevibacterium sp. VCM10]|uniref:TRAP transporter small permease n=1 Tax=Brevibacterium sp. VCM10 TaxID=1381751 RepID=UPI0004704E55|nr:TRAP transporter small permease [Brevibacterium sp. VCM10]
MAPRAQRPSATQMTVAATARASLWLAGLMIVALFVLMLVEAFMRYVLSSPLGWNVSATERILMPGSLFFALPWLYATGGHVSAEMLYDRLPAGLKLAARWVTVILVIAAAGILSYSGLRGVIDSFQLGLAPLPNTAELPIPNWIWQLIQPIGALGLLLVAVLDAPRFLRLDGAAAVEADSDETGGAQ